MVLLCETYLNLYNIIIIQFNYCINIGYDISGQSLLCVCLCVGVGVGVGVTEMFVSCVIFENYVTQSGVSGFVWSSVCSYLPGLPPAGSLYAT